MYGKHFESMYTGSMCGAGALAFAVWGYVISHQKPTNGRDVFTVELNPKILATLIGESEEDITEQIKEFCAPDPKSRTEDEDGRKLIQESPYTYRVVNGPKYDRIRREDERREYNRERQRRIRAKDSQHAGGGEDNGEGSAFDFGPETKDATQSDTRQITLDRAIKRAEERIKVLKAGSYAKDDPRREELKTLLAKVSDMKVELGVPI